MARLLLELRRGDQVTELELTPLSAAETADLAAPPPIAIWMPRPAAIHRTTEGNPLFIVETSVRARSRRPASVSRGIPR